MRAIKGIFSTDNYSKVFVSVLTALSVTFILFLVAYVTSSFASVRQGSRDGTEALEKVIIYDERIEYLEECNTNQHTLNVLTQKQLEIFISMMEDVKKSINKVDEKIDKMLLKKY